MINNLKRAHVTVFDFFLFSPNIWIRKENEFIRTFNDGQNNEKQLVCENRGIGSGIQWKYVQIENNSTKASIFFIIIIQF